MRLVNDQSLQQRYPRCVLYYSNFSGHCQHASGMAACTLFVYVLHVAELRAAYQHGKVSS
jgi:hypothetical protein